MIPQHSFGRLGPRVGDEPVVEVARELHRREATSGSVYHLTSTVARATV